MHVVDNNISYFIHFRLLVVEQSHKLYYRSQV